MQALTRPKPDSLTPQQQSPLTTQTRMNEANTRRLFERFHHLYRGRFLPANRMRDGFCCGDGWFDLPWGLSEQLEAYCQTHPDCADLIVLQVKEKFGGLRFYVEPSNQDIRQFIGVAIVKSRQTCELTGYPGVLCYRSGTVQTLCLEKAWELGFEPCKPVTVHSIQDEGGNGNARPH